MNQARLGTRAQSDWRGATNGGRQQPRLELRRHLVLLGVLWHIAQRREGIVHD